MKTALVTGAGKRIGRALALALAEDGYDLYLHYHSAAAEAEDLARAVLGMGRRAVAIAADLADPAAAGCLPDRCADFGPPVCLINNAAIYRRDALADLTADGFDRHIALNLRAPLLLARGFAARLGPGDAGSIVNLLDYRVAALPAAFLSYTVSKAGLAAATEMLALDLAPRIRVNAIAPGLALESDHETGGRYETLRANTPLQRGVAPADIVAAMRYLLAAPGVTGQTIFVDSGQRLVSRRKAEK